MKNVSGNRRMQVQYTCYSRKISEWFSEFEVKPDHVTDRLDWNPLGKAIVYHEVSEYLIYPEDGYCHVFRCELCGKFSMYPDNHKIQMHNVNVPILAVPPCQISQHPHNLRNKFNG